MQENEVKNGQDSVILYLFSAGCGATAGNPAPDFYLRHHPLSLPIVKKKDILQKNPIRSGIFLFFLYSMSNTANI